jgi:hypothetical protein
MEMNTYNGTFLALLVETSSTNYKPLAHCTNHQLAVDRASREVSSKSTGKWTNREYVRIDWNISAEGMLTFHTDASNLSWLLTQLINGTKVKVISVLLDHVTSGKAPLTDDTAIVVRDAAGDDAIDEDSTTIETTADNFYMTSVFSDDTPYAYYGQGVLANVSKVVPDGETVTFNCTIEGDGALLPLAIGAFA